MLWKTIKTDLISLLYFPFLKRYVSYVQVVHRWIPNHPNPNKRSTFDRTILLIKIDDKYVPISENGVQDLGAEV